MRFADRRHAGRMLAQALRSFHAGNALIVGLPRGGVPVAAEVARTLGLDLDVIIVRKLGLPYQPELAMGAVGERNVRVLNTDVLDAASIDGETLETITARESDEVARRAELFRQGRPPIAMTGRTVVVVDDGVATGSTARAACLLARANGASRIVLAIPIGPPDVRRRFADVADEIVCLTTPRGFHAVGQGYDDFSQLSDADVIRLLQPASRGKS